MKFVANFITIKLHTVNFITNANCTIACFVKNKPHIPLFAYSF